MVLVGFCLVENEHENVFTTVMNLSDGDFHSEHFRRWLCYRYDRQMHIKPYELFLDDKELVVEVHLEDNVVKFKRV